jgi:hypothetical protein
VPKTYSPDGLVRFVDSSLPDDASPKVFIEEGATAVIRKKNSTAQGNPVLRLESPKPYVTNSGTFKIDSVSKVEFTPTVNPTTGQPATGLGGGLLQNNSKAVTELTSGSIVTCGKKTSVAITQGKLKLLDHSTTDERDEAQAEITIESPDTDKATATLNIGASAEMLHAANTKGMLHLVVDGNLANYGTVTMVVSHVANKSDTIECKGIVDFYPDSHLNVWWYQETGTSLVPNTWVLITSSYSGDEDPIADSSTLGQVADPNYSMTVTKETSLDKKQLRLKSWFI